MKKFLSLLLAVAMLLALAACGAGSDKNEPAGGQEESEAKTDEAPQADQEEPAEEEEAAEETEEAEEAPSEETEPAESTGEKKDTLNVALYDDIGDLSPWGTTTIQSSFVRGAIYDTLMVQYMDDTEFFPCAAESYETGEDGFTYIFHLRKDLVDGKGNQIKAEDVLYSFEQARQNSTQDMLTSSFNYDLNKAIDEYTVQLGVNTKGTTCFGKLCMINLVSQKSFEESEGMITDAVGTGAYKLDDWLVGSTMKLSKNENTWHEVKQFENVNITFIMDPSQRTNALMTGDIDVFSYCQISDMEYIDSLDGFSSYSIGTVTTDGLVLNNDPSSVCADENVRLAIAYGIDNQAIANVVFSGQATVATAPYSTSSLGYSDAWADCTGYEYDLEKAKEYFAKSGLPEGTELRCMCQSAGDQEAIAVVVQSMLKEVGFNVTITSLEASVLDSMLFDNPSEWDFLSHFWISGGGMGGAIGSINLHSMLNFYHMPDGEERDALLENVNNTMEETDNEKYLAGVADLVHYTSDHALMYGICYPNFRYAAISELQNIRFTAEERLVFENLTTG